MNETAFDAPIPLPPLVAARTCACHGHAPGAASACPDHGARFARRGFTALLGAAALGSAWPAGAQELPECKRSGFTKVVPAEQLEAAASQQYVQMLRQADGQRQLAPRDHPQLQRLRYIGQRLVPFTEGCNDRARQWRWEVNLIRSNDLNAFCMPGGKIAFFYGILAKLQLSDDETAMIMGHEIAHALLEHARERVGKTAATRGAIEIGAALLGLGNTGRLFADLGGQLLTLRFSRDDEAEADALGLVLAARAGYDPASGVTLWRKMKEASKGAPPQWLSTHPSGDSRIQDIEARLPRVRPMFESAQKPPLRFEPPKPRG